MPVIFKLLQNDLIQIYSDSNMKKSNISEEKSI